MAAAGASALAPGATGGDRRPSGKMAIAVERTLRPIERTPLLHPSLRRGAHRAVVPERPR